MTKVYGASDDLIEFEGDVTGEMGCYGTDEAEQGVLLVCSDGTVLEIKYGKNGEGIWGITVRHRGALYEGIDQCDDEEADPYSDVAKFRDGLTWAYGASCWERIK